MEAPPTYSAQCHMDQERVLTLSRMLYRYSRCYYTRTHLHTGGTMLFSCSGYAALILLLFFFVRDAAKIVVSLFSAAAAVFYVLYVCVFCVYLGCAARLLNTYGLVHSMHLTLKHGREARTLDGCSYITSDTFSFFAILCTNNTVHSTQALHLPHTHKHLHAYHLPNMNMHTGATHLQFVRVFFFFFCIVSSSCVESDYGREQ